MNLIDNLRRMITPVSNEDEDYDLDFEEQDSPFLDDRPRSYDRSAVDSRRGKVVNIHATTQLKVVLVKPERFENASEIADHLKEKRTVVVQQGHRPPPNRLSLRRGLRGGGQDQEGGRKYLSHHPLLRGHPGGSDRRAGDQRPLQLQLRWGPLYVTRKGR